MKHERLWLGSLAGAIVLLSGVLAWVVWPASPPPAPAALLTPVAAGRSAPAAAEVPQSPVAKPVERTVIKPEVRTYTPATQVRLTPEELARIADINNGISIEPTQGASILEMAVWLDTDGYGVADTYRLSQADKTARREGIVLWEREGYREVVTNYENGQPAWVWREKRVGQDWFRHGFVLHRYTDGSSDEMHVKNGRVIFGPCPRARTERIGPPLTIAATESFQRLLEVKAAATRPIDMKSLDQKERDERATGRFEAWHYPGMRALVGNYEDGRPWKFRVELNDGKRWISHGTEVTWDKDGKRSEIEWEGGEIVKK